MSRNASVTLDWGDGTYEFRLGWGELAKLQEACDAGPFVILDRLRSGTCRLEDISNVIRWGLVGGNKTPAEATKLVRLYVEDRPPAENRTTAYVIMAAGCSGAPEEQIEKKSPAPDRESTIYPTERSGSEHSTD
ncbi:gene transfer agent family protein [Bradyrhizobium barranii subsp. apii]|uniref:gene transfer agent family protein n=1 Tax=Bradyrhizobium barranii TaxID=2992140 RepID=UPI001AA1AFC6|nr:gene transfer agent family protein [Bradyrhizobium barranii]UPT93895.1 gene transfer agent family protein [Bradyrhizobium barranii subsp. apii]